MKEIKLKDNHVLRIETCDYIESPREWCNLGTMVCFHSNYNLGDKHDYNQSDYNSWEELKLAIIKDKDVAIILPLYLYDHSGITMNTTGFSCRWDSGQVGFIYISKEKIREEYHIKKITQKVKDRIKTYLVNEVKTFDQYISGEVYQYELVKINTCECCEETSEEHIDSCGGFYGYDIKENGMLEYIPSEFHDEILEAV